MAIKGKINVTTIKSFRPEDKRLNDTEIAGFHARITPAGKIHYYLFYRLDGKQVNYKLGTEGQITPAIARDLAKEKAGEVAKGINVQQKKKAVREAQKKAAVSTLEKFIELQYQPWLYARNPKTAHSFIRDLKVNFGHLMNHQLSAITAWEIEKWRNDKKNSGIKPATINRRLTSLKGCMSRAVEWGVIESHDLNKVKAYQEDNSKVRYLNADEESRLRAAMRQRDQDIKQQRDSGNRFRQERGYELLPDLNQRHFADHLEPIVLLAMNTGMRRGELLSLKWSSIDLERKNLTVLSENAKSGKSRHIPLNTEAHNTLSHWMQDTGSTGYVFKNPDGSPLKEIRKSWATVIESAGIDNFRFHDLRHHFASKLVMARVDLNTVRELLGHADLAMTLRYAHLAPEHKAAAVNLIG
ncbi:site-specific integrase [Alkalimonas delamerensis]|uniref:Site-specific integrase n=1 Tax=Alkalimonas delamerensis TaxID=265981 RepID=A0ABT9GTU0_9GAMM|nr:site-specific integrase [Alkalimonas delamerensis]MDP4530388.1 site-specific integrase [Alkalimonas delamerensis]